MYIDLILAYKFRIFNVIIKKFGAQCPCPCPGPMLLLVPVPMCPDKLRCPVPVPTTGHGAGRAFANTSCIHRMSTLSYKMYLFSIPIRK